MKKKMVISMARLLNPPMLAPFVENPPVDIVVQAWQTDSKNVMPSTMRITTRAVEIPP